MDMSKYLGIFATEAAEHLEAMGRELLRFENERSGELVDAVFRHAHSVKGMAASMGFEPIAHLAHLAEDLIGAIRDRPRLLRREAIDLLLRTTDALTALVKLAVDGAPLPADPELAAALSAELCPRT